MLPALLRAKMSRKKRQRNKPKLVCEILKKSIAQKTFKPVVVSDRELERQRVFALNKALQKVSNDYDARDK